MIGYSLRHLRERRTMSTLDTKKRKAWCIVVADDHGPEFLPSTTGVADGVDEDYLVPGEATEGPGLAMLGMARRPVGWVAQHLRQRGAMVASGILTGYAGVFAEHIHKRWPGIAQALSDIKAAAVHGENQLRSDMCDVPRSALRSLRWSPATFPQRALRVFGCGWRGLHSARAVSRINVSCVLTLDSEPQFLPKVKTQPRRTSPPSM
jgi:hypothetical protein